MQNTHLIYKMKQALVAAFLFFPIQQAIAQDTPYATLQGDTLRLGNRYVERCMLWHGGNPITLSLLDKVHHTVLATQHKEPDFSLLSAQPSDARLTVDTLQADGIRGPHLEATVSFRAGGVEVRRSYVLYPDCPAIACRTQLRGTLSAQDMVKVPWIERLQLPGKHWQTRTVEFFDRTDENDNLVAEHTAIPYRRQTRRGNLLFARDLMSDRGFFFLKEAPCSEAQIGYPGFDFTYSYGDFQVNGLGILPTDVDADHFVSLYTTVTGVYSGGEQQALMALRSYQREIRSQAAAADEMIMMNTWGDRSQDTRINEAFCLDELDRCARLGITVFQLDDGWEEGKSPNARGGGSFTDIWKKGDYWQPSRQKFPRGFAPVIEKARRLGIRIGLWFNPSIQDDFADWEKDAQVMIDLHRQYGITVFKIDGLQIPTKRAEENLLRLFDRVLAQTDNRVIFNLDATAGRRAGYFMLARYGNIFLENRYSDWGNYYPFHTLRNLWQLSRYVPAEKLQIEFLNPWRNPQKYPADDIFAPCRYDFPYLFALTMAAQPLAWMEAQNLPQEAYAAGSLIHQYQQVQHRFHQGTILPIGEEPSGRSWTGFQSLLSDSEGYLLVYRELTDRTTAELDTWLTGGRDVTLQPILGDAATPLQTTVSDTGRIRLSLPSPHTFALYHYRVN